MKCIRMLRCLYESDDAARDDSTQLLPEANMRDVHAWSREPELSKAAFLLKWIKDGKKPRSGGLADYLQYERYVQHTLQKAALQPQYATIKRGQAFIWASNLFHGGSPQTDKTRTRHSQVTHYDFDECRYYTPLGSTSTRTKWRTPEWIT